MQNWIHCAVIIVVCALFQNVQAQWKSLDSSFWLTSSLEFTSNDTGFAGGNGILKTVDGGKTFTKLAIPSSDISLSILTMSWPTSTIGYAGGDALNFIGYAGYLIKTMDAGVTWKRLPIDTAYINYKIQFPTPLVGYILQGSGGGNGYRIVKTIDGGETWKVVVPLTQSIPTINFRNEREGFFAVGRPSAGMDIKYTDDGLATTSYRDSGLYPDVLTTVYNIEPVDDGAWLISAEGSLYRTTDLGLNWNMIKIPNEQYLQSMKMKHNIGFEYSLLSTPIMNMTTDYGLTWNYTILPDSGGYIKALSIPSTKNAYAIVKTMAPGTEYQLIKYSSPLAVRLNEAERSLSVSYNNDVISFGYPLSETRSSLDVFDLLGRRQMSLSISTNSRSTDVIHTTLPQGAYIARMGTSAVKFVVMR